ncbi:MAG: hypothetical protein HYU64_19240 [Armatimonadetes bacterium]|nr:hypothetical protein [Armatimonadota bacterium]
MGTIITALGPNRTAFSGVFNHLIPLEGEPVKILLDQRITAPPRNPVDDAIAALAAKASKTRARTVLPDGEGSRTEKPKKTEPPKQVAHPPTVVKAPKPGPTNPSIIMASLTPQEKAEFAYMPEEDKVKFLELMAAVAPYGYTHPELASENTPTPQQLVKELLVKGRLQDRDKDNKSLVADLHAMIGQNFWMPADKAGLRFPYLCFAIGDVARPPQFISQGFQSGTCDVTSIMHADLAMRHPAEYVRLLSGLAGNQGAATMISGHPFLRDDTTFQSDPIGRTLTSAVFQGALMKTRDDFHHADALGREVDNPYLIRTVVDDDTRVAMVDDTLGWEDSRRRYPLGELVAAIRKETEKGNSVPIQVIWPGANWHQIRIVQVTDDTVTYWNPFTYYSKEIEAEQHFPPVEGRVFLSDGYEQIPVSTLEKRLLSADFYGNPWMKTSSSS